MKTNETEQTTRQDYFLNKLLDLTESMEHHTFTLHTSHPPDMQELTIDYQGNTIDVLFYENHLFITGTNIHTMVFYREQPKWTYKAFNYGPLFISRFTRHLQCMNGIEYILEPSIIRSDIIDGLYLDDIDNDRQTDEEIIKNVDCFIEDMENLVLQKNSSWLDNIKTTIAHESTLPGLNPDMITHVIGQHNQILETNDIYLDPHEPEDTEPFHRAGYVVHPDIFYVHVLLTYIATNPERLIKSKK